MHCIEYDEENVPFIKLGDYTLRLDLEDLNEEFKEKARNELRETPDLVEDSLVQLRRLLKDEKDLNIPLDDDSFLMSFLRPCKFYPDSTFKLIKRYYKFKMKNQKYCTELLPRKVRHVFCDSIIQFIPTRTPEGSRVMVINSGTKWDVKTVTLQDLFKSIMMALQIAMIEPKTQVGGVHVVLDMEGLTLHHVYQFTPFFAKMLLDWIQDCIPLRLKGIHVVNQPYIFNMLYAIFKPFVREKLRRRLHFHGTNWSAFTEHVSPKSLPDFYGGEMTIPDYPGSLLADLLLLYESDFEWTNSLGYKKEKQSKKDELNVPMVLS